MKKNKLWIVSLIIFVGIVLIPIVILQNNKNKEERTIYCTVIEVYEDDGVLIEVTKKSKLYTENGDQIFIVKSDIDTTNYKLQQNLKIILTRDATIQETYPSSFSKGSIESIEIVE